MKLGRKAGGQCSPVLCARGDANKPQLGQPAESLPG